VHRSAAADLASLLNQSCLWKYRAAQLVTVKAKASDEPLHAASGGDNAWLIVCQRDWSCRYVRCLL